MKRNIEKAIKEARSHIEKNGVDKHLILPDFDRVATLAETEAPTTRSYTVHTMPGMIAWYGFLYGYSIAVRTMKRLEKKGKERCMHALTLDDQFNQILDDHPEILPDAVEIVTRLLKEQR